MTRPNFFVIGAQKAGTTSLYYYLRQHPEVFMSPVKEPHFFVAYGAKKGKFSGPSRNLTPRITTLERYEALFGGATDEKAIGEASPTYLYVPEVAGRIKRYAPEAKLAAVLRNPAERAYSAYLHTVRSGREPLSFAEALAEEEQRVREGWHHIYHYRNRGFYHGQVKRYFDLFGPGQVRVHLYEDLSEDPVGVSRDLFRFLGVNDAFEPDVSIRYNPSGVPKNPAVTALIKRTRAAVPLIKHVLPFEARQRIKGRIFAEPPPLPPELRRDLADSYREDVKQLQALLGRDLSGWLKEDAVAGATA